MIIQEMRRDQVADVWQIDRSEVIDGIFYHIDGDLVLRAEHYDMTGWPPDEIEQNGLLLLDCYDRGGTFYGAFEHDELVGVAVLGSKFVGRPPDQLQLKFLHVSNSYRQRGLGKTLFHKAAERAQELGAKRLYISATPSENTVKFYLRRGCVLVEHPDPELYALEPDDIHLEYVIPHKLP